jgi:cytochrome P450
MKPADSETPHEIRGGCPVDHSYTMMDESFLADPYPVFDRVREEHPVFYASELDAYVVARYEDVDTVLSDPETYSSSVVVSPLKPLSDEAKQLLDDVDFYRPPNLINADGARHKMVRGFVQQAMSPTRLRALEPLVREWGTEQIKRMIDAGGGDFVADLAFPLPALTGFTLLGFPNEDIEMIKSWCNDRVAYTYGLPTYEEQLEATRNVAAFWVYTNEFAAKRIAEPLDDLASDLARRHLEDPEVFTPRDVATVLFEMALAAHETTTNGLTNGLRRLLEHPEQWKALVEDHSLIPNAVEECLRFDGSNIAWRRRTTTETELGGVTIPADTTVIVLLGCANHDPDRFDQPNEFDITRTDARKHMTFSKGVHFCQGAPLARMEIRVIFEILSELAPDIKLVPDQELSFIPNLSIRGPRSLLIELSPAKVATG